MRRDDGSVIRLTGASKYFRRGTEIVTALEGADLEVRRGEIVAVVGPSGSGKTTLLNILCGWQSPDKGQAEWLGSGGVSAPADVRWDGIAIVPQSLGLVEDLTLAENVELPAKISGGLDPSLVERAGRLMAGLRVDHLANRYPLEASLGEQQRAAFARGLILQPDLLLADEPTGHQDDRSAGAVIAILREAAANGTSCLVATHDPAIGMHTDRVLGIRDGRLQET